MRHSTGTFLRMCVCVCAGVSLSGCTGLLPLLTSPSSPAPITYQMQPSILSNTRGEVMKGTQLYVSLPDAIEVLGGSQILIRPERNLVGYLPGVQWADRLPRLVQEYIVDAFREEGSLDMATHSTNAIPSGYQLLTDIQDFSVFEKFDGYEAHVKIYIVLSSGLQGGASFGQQFEATVPLEAEFSTDVAVDSLEYAFSIVLTRMVRWAKQKIQVVEASKRS